MAYTTPKTDWDTSDGILNTDLNRIEANTEQNHDDTVTNAANISSNDTDIANNASNISTNTTNISSNDTDIANNASNISTNTSNISTNATNISSNDTDISSLDTRLTTAEGNITSNDTDISTNASDISDNTDDITANATLFGVWDGHKGVNANYSVANAGSSTTFAVNKAECISDDAALQDRELLLLTSAMTKNVTENWEIGSGANQGSICTTITPANNKWYHIFLIKHGTTQALDIALDDQFDGSTIAAQMTAYTKKRRIGSVRRRNDGTLMPAESVNGICEVLEATVVSFTPAGTSVTLQDANSLGLTPGNVSHYIYCYVELDAVTSKVSLHSFGMGGTSYNGAVVYGNDMVWFKVNLSNVFRATRITGSGSIDLRLSAYIENYE